MPFSLLERGVGALTEGGKRMGREKKRANRRSYKFTNKTHPTKAICSTILGGVSLFGICGAIYFSFLEQGLTKPGYGLTGLLAVLFSLVGVILGFLSFRERDSFYVLSWVGTILNLVVLFGAGFLFSLGI